MANGTFPQFEPSLLPWLRDESLFSLCSRHHRLWGHSNAVHTTVALFGRPRVGTHHDLPNGLWQCEQRTEGLLGSGIGIAETRTLLRYYRPFLNPEEFRRAGLLMCGPSVAHLKLRIGILTSRFRANHPLKACSQCIEADIEAHGWSYWHLTHQYPGLWVCPIHGSPLMESSIKSNGVQRFQWHLPTSVGVQENWSAASSDDEMGLRRLTDFVQVLVDRDEPGGWLQLASVQPVIRNRLRELGWLSTAGNIRLAKAAAPYAEHCRPLRSVGELNALPGDVNQAQVQLAGLLRAARGGTHPIRLLAALAWLFDDAPHFLEVRSNFIQSGERDGAATSLVGDGRSVHHHDVRRERVSLAVGAGASASSVARKEGLDVATVMAWAAAEGHAVSRRPKFLRGELRAGLIASLVAGEDVRVAAEQFGVALTTVARLLHTEVGLHEAWAHARFARAQTEARNSWLTAIASSPGLGTKILRESNPATYAWLYRNDRAWLAEHTPDKRSRDAARDTGTVRWDERDAALSQKVREVALGLASKGATRPIRLWQICQCLPELRAKLGALARLPMTLRAIEETVGRRRKRSPSGSLLDDE